ncbi:MAG: radical SAM protein [Nitrospirae bacterium]|nr:radical SAM protein [Nitrospirota bacterium]
MKIKKNIVELKKGGLHLFIDPDAPNWISCNKAGAEIIKGGIIKSAGIESGDFSSRLKEEGFLDSAHKINYPGRAMVIETKRLSDLWIYTNNSCNLRCKHCLVSAGEGGKDSLSAADIMRIIDEAKSLGVRRFYFTGGEPFLRHDIFALINYITRDRELVILTNGTLFTKEKAEGLALVKNKLFLQISLESSDAKIHDSIRGEGSFELAVNGIKNLIDAGIVPTITTTITRLNMDSAVNTHRFIASLGIKVHHILYLHPKGRMQRFRDELYISSDELSETMLRLIEASRETAVIIDNAESFKARISGKKGRKTDLCNCCYEMLCVDSDGEVYPCAAIAGDKRFSAGNARDYSLSDLWLDSPLTKRIRGCSLNDIEKCCGCYLRFMCGGGCFCYGYFNEEIKTGAGRLEAVDPYCNTYKMLIENALWAQAEKGVDKEGLDKKTPVIYNSMGSEISACLISSVKQINPNYEVAGYHCSCVLTV